MDCSKTLRNKYFSVISEIYGDHFNTNKKSYVFPDKFCEKSNGELPSIKKIYSGKRKTIVLFEDGTKTICKCMDCDTFDLEKGIMICLIKRIYGNSGFKKIIKFPVINSEKNNKDFKACTENKEITQSIK